VQVRIAAYALVLEWLVYPQAAEMKCTFALIASSREMSFLISISCEGHEGCEDFTATSFQNLE
jgi:hypothetical protein